MITKFNYFLFKDFFSVTHLRKPSFWGAIQIKSNLVCIIAIKLVFFPWLVHLTSNNKTIYHQMLWVGNIMKTMMSNEKQFIVTQEMLPTVAHDWRVQLMVAWCHWWNLSAFFKICFCFLLLYNFGEQWILYPLSEYFPWLRWFPGNKMQCSSWQWSSSVTYKRSLNTERSYITRLRCSACQSQIPTDDQCSNLIGLFTQV